MQNKMIHFNPATAMESAMEVKDQQEADQYLKDYTLHIQKSNSNITSEEARLIAKQNIGYYAGYYDHDTGWRMEKLFGAVHPILGNMETRTKLSSQQIFELGKAWASKNN